MTNRFPEFFIIVPDCNRNYIESRGKIHTQGMTTEMEQNVYFVAEDGVDNVS